MAADDSLSGALAGAGKPVAAALRSTHGASGHTVDFGRNVCMILGLTFDVVDCAEAEARIRAAAAARSRLFVSTPNTNFVISCQNDTAFRKSVLHSDLSLIDGMPIVWVARLMGVPVPERVSGADIFERLGRLGSAPLSTYFFGGPPGAAAHACDRLNEACGPLTCLGFDAAGFGDVDEMSAEATLDRINASGADFLVVALGASKGQAWIEHNLPRLEVPIVSHLGRGGELHGRIAEARADLDACCEGSNGCGASRKSPTSGAAMSSTVGPLVACLLPGSCHTRSVVN